MFLWRSLRALGAAAVLALSVAACGGSSGSTTVNPDTTPPTTPPAQAETVDLTGTVATGAAIPNATVTAINSAGKTATATTSSSGDFTLTIEKGEPYLLKAVSPGGEILYSYSAAAGRANITQLTTLALSEANTRKPLADLFTNWATTQVTAAAITEAISKVNANFHEIYTAAGVDWATYDFFTTQFSANGTGIDAVLDDLTVDISCSSSSCSYSITDNRSNSSITFDGSIDVTDIEVTPGGTIPSNSTWTVQLTGNVNGQTINQAIGGVPLEQVPTNADMGLSVLQTTGGFSGAISQPGVSMSFSYSNLTTSYTGCGACGVGSTIVMHVTGSITISGTANGVSIPPTTVQFDLTYTFTRTA